MSVDARPAKVAPSTASVDLHPLRADHSLTAGTYPYDGPDITTGWHVHDMHQLEYAFQGVVQVETATARYLLPPQQAVWIPAGLAHCTTLKRVRTVSVFFDPVTITEPEHRARVIMVEPVLREMIIYGARWPVTRRGSDSGADTFFAALGTLVGDGLDHERPFHLPTATDPDVAAAMRFTDEQLRSVTLTDVCKAVALSERTLRRRFLADTGITWRQYLLRSRLLHAMSLLTEPAVGVSRVALDCGFDSPSAFARSFTAYTGQSPSAYRRRASRGTELMT